METLKIFQKKSHSAEKIEKEPLVSSGFYVTLKMGEMKRGPLHKLRRVSADRSSSSVVPVKSLYYAYILLSDEKRKEIATVTVVLILLECADY